jgi:iron(III) transport system permease protein
VVVTVMVLLPVVFLLWQAGHAGWGTIWPLIFRSLTWTLLLNTIELGVIVTVCSAVVGVGSAWLIERTNLPLRRFWRAVVVLPLAIPDFVIGYTWLSLAPAVHGLFGASLVMTLGLYPLVYLPVAAALRRVDSSLYEVARSLGLGRFRALLGTVLPQIRAALLGGCLMVLLGLLAEYGAFEILRFQTFTTEIFTEFNLGINPAAASALSLVLVVLSLLVIGTGSPSRRTWWGSRRSRCSARPGTRCCTASWPRCWRPSRRSPSRTWRCATPGGCPARSNGSGISCRACQDW